MKYAAHVTFLTLRFLSIISAVQLQNSAPTFYASRVVYPRYSLTNYGSYMGGLLQGIVQGGVQNAQTVAPLLSGMYGPGIQVRSSNYGANRLYGSPLTSLGGNMAGYPIAQTNSILQTPLIHSFVGGGQGAVTYTGQNGLASNNFLQLLLSSILGSSTVVVQQQQQIRPRYSGGYFIYMVPSTTHSITTLTTTRPTSTTTQTTTPTTRPTSTQATTLYTGTTVRTTPYTGVTSTTTLSPTTTTRTTITTLGDYSYETFYPI